MAKAKKAPVPAAVIEEVKKTTRKSVVEDLGALGLSIQQKLDEIRAELDRRITLVAEHDAVIAQQREEIAEISEIKDEAIQLAAIREERLAIEAEVEEYRAELDEERRREEEEYQYNIKRKRKAEEDTWDDAIKKKKVDWDAREAALKASEAELKEWKGRADRFDVEVDEAAQALYDANKIDLEKDFAHKKEILDKEVEAVKKDSAREVSILQSENDRLIKQVDALIKQLDAARLEIKEIANNAVNASSDRRVADSIQQLAATQAAAPKK